MLHQNKKIYYSINNKFYVIKNILINTIKYTIANFLLLIAVYTNVNKIINIEIIIKNKILALFFSNKI